MTPNGEKVEMLKKEIELVMERNKNETYLKFEIAPYARPRPRKTT